MQAIKNRTCDVSGRIVTNAYPIISTTVTADIAIGDTETELVFEAERDVLFTHLSVTAHDAAGANVGARASLVYCNTVMLDEVDIAVLAPCCPRKPPIALGVRENKKARLKVVLDAANAAIVTVAATYSGYQGSGCCS